MIWPRMRFSDGKIDAAATIEKLFAKRAALTLVLFDCCNNLSSKDSQAVESIKTFELKRKNDPRIAANFRKLFLKRCGVLVASAAKPKEYSGGDGDRVIFERGTERWEKGGSYFTNAFFNTLFEEVELPSPHWRSIFRKTKRICHKGNKEENGSLEKISRHRSPQTPQYVILIGSKKKEVREYLRYLQKHCLYCRRHHHSKDLDVESRFPDKVRKAVCFVQALSCDEE